MNSRTYLCGKFQKGMGSKRGKSLLALVFSAGMMFFSYTSFAQSDSGQDQRKYPSAGTESAEAKTEKKLDPSQIIMGHVSDGHEFHFFTFHNNPVVIPLPILLYSPSKGFDCFMSSAFEDGAATPHGYRLLEGEFMESHKLENVKDASGKLLFQEGKIYATDDQGMPDANVKVYDFSLTRNVVQLLISLILLSWLMMNVAKKYKNGHGVRTAPTGFQNAVEPVITFVRDEVAKPNLGARYEKYMPYLLTVFFFILINNLVGLIPGSANVSGNIAFTAFLGIISFIVIMFSTNKHYWGHIINPPVPFAIKFIMVPIEILGIFTKPFALIIRLFANMISGHIIILSFIILIFIFGAMTTSLGWATSPLFVLFSVFIYLLELLVAFIQAFIFANLTAVFIGQAFEGGHDDHGDHHEDAVII